MSPSLFLFFRSRVAPLQIRTFGPCFHRAPKSQNPAAPTEKTKNEMQQHDNDHCPIALDKVAFAGGVHSVRFTPDGQHLLTGIGPYFCIFHVLSGVCLLRRHLFDGGCIKGIQIFSLEPLASPPPQPDLPSCIQRHHVMVFGQRKICFLTLRLLLDDLNGLNDNMDHHGSNTRVVQIDQIVDLPEMNDWVLDVKLLNEMCTETTVTIAVGFARNFVKVIQFPYDFALRAKRTNRYMVKELNVLHTVHGYPNCLLYSMSLYGEHVDKLLVAAGTIFTQISVWSFVQCQSNQSALIILNGHDGVLFRVEWAKDGKALCSTSDDRTIRFWKFSHGFEATPDYRTPSYKTVTMFGHGARVWDCKMIDDFIISCSEDKTVRVWDYSGTCVYVFRGHTGKNVWRIDVDESQSIIASGGGDSSIKLWSLDDVRQSLQQGNHKQYILPGIDLNSKFDSTSEFTRFLKINNQFVYCVTNKSLLYKVDTITDQISLVVDINSLRSAEDQKHFIMCFSLSPCSRFCALGDTGGNCLIVDLQNKTVVNSISVFSTRVLNSFWISRSDGSTFLFLTSPQGSLKLYTIGINDDQLNVQSERVLTIKNIAMSTCYVESLDVLMIGDNRGNIHVFRNRALHQPSPNSSQSNTPDFTLRNAHGKDKVADIKFIDVDRIYSVGRDGCLCVNKLVVMESTDKTELVQVSQTRLNNTVPTAEHLYISKDAEDIIIFGFYGSHFTVFDFTKNYRIATFDCGGAKGTYDVTYENYYGLVDSHMKAAAENRSYFAAFSKGGILHTHIEARHMIENPRFQVQSLNVNYHGRETRDVLLWHSNQSRKNRLITCSEDTTVRIFDYSTEHDNGFLSNSLIMNGHESGVKALSIIEHDNYHVLFSGGGKEELFIWKILESDNNNNNHGLNFELLQGLQVTTKFIDFFHPDIRNQLNKIHFRVMSMCSFHLSNDKICLITGASDGYLKIFIYHVLENTLTPHSFARYHKGPVLSMQYAQVEDQYLVMTGSTDGQIAIHRLDKSTLLSNPTEQQFEPLFTLEAHQSGVNSLSVHQSGSDFTIASGGDDQALFVAKFTYTNGQMINTRSKSLPMVHTAAINGISTNGRFLFETSIDQRFNVFSIVDSGESVDLTLVAAIMLEVNDICAMSTLETGTNTMDVAVCGAELQIIQVKV